MKTETVRELDGFFDRCPQLKYLRENAEKCAALIAGLRAPNKLMTCGCGGSCADAAHITGELLKEFKRKRTADAAFCAAYESAFGADGFTAKLQGSIPAVALSSQDAVLTAIANDIGADCVFAQQVYGLGAKGDILIALSTSGNSASALYAARAARLLGVTVVAFTGADGGKLRGVSDMLFNVPETETYRVQELHLPLYHLLCACAESERWA
jgi:phosphoheptose isomerase